MLSTLLGKIIIFALIALFFIVIGVILLIKYNILKVNPFISIPVCILLVVFVIAFAVLCTFIKMDKYYDRDGSLHISLSNMIYDDSNGNKYTYDYDNKGYDYLYKNGTDESFYADWCYLDEDGYMHYDDDMSIIAKDEHSCVDTDGKIYYPAKFTTLDKNGKIKYSFNSENFRYDRLGNAYTYDYVPFYDKDGNKYYYSFNSDIQKGTYTNIGTGEAYGNEHSFVDEDGYFVYDDAHVFEQVKDKDGNKIYTDDKGNTYYWASSVTWDKDGNLRSSLL